jgi:hypothetical protein
MTTIRLWNKRGLEIIGTFALAFSHPQLGFVDGFVMYRWLTS